MASTLASAETAATLPRTMKTIIRDRYGSADVLRLSEVELPEVADEHLHVRVRAAAPLTTTKPPAGLIIAPTALDHTPSFIETRRGTRRAAGPRDRMHRESNRAQVKRNGHPTHVA